MEGSSSQELGKARKKRIGCNHLNYYMEMTFLKNTMLPKVPPWSSYIIDQNVGMPGTSYLSSSFPTKPTADAENHPSLPNFLLESYRSALAFFENTRKETQCSSVAAGFWMKRASLTVGPLLQLELQVMSLERALFPWHAWHLLGNSKVRRPECQAARCCGAWLRQNQFSRTNTLCKHHNVIYLKALLPTIQNCCEFSNTMINVSTNLCLAQSRRSWAEEILPPSSSKWTRAPGASQIVSRHWTPWRCHSTTALVFLTASPSTSLFQPFGVF